MRSRSRGGIGTVFVALIALAAAPAPSETLRVGKAVASNFGFVPLDVGVAQGLFQKEGLEIESFDFTGGAKQQQAMTAGSLDIALAAGTDLAYIAKGAPEIGIGSVTSSPVFLAISVADDAGIHALGDLKGRKLGVTSTGSLTYWLVHEFNRVQGWGGGGAMAVPIGGQLTTEIAALRTHQVDGILASLGAGYTLENEKIAHVLLPCSSYVSELEFFTIIARTETLQQHGDAVRGFLKGWYEAVAYMRTHKVETVAISSRVDGFPLAVAEREYDQEMAAMSADGRFKPKALATLATTFSELNVLPGPADFSKLVTDQFLPKK